MANPAQTKRALVLQGGVALGAYEAGVISKLCGELHDKTKDRENIFDVVCGTSAVFYVIPSLLYANIRSLI